MGSTTVPVTADWALWGKTERDAGYRLLECSDGIISGREFADVLTRYSPGTLDRLPQVTVSWLPADDKKESHLAIAIHDQGGLSRYDVSGREIVRTRYFCAPYAVLAEGSVTYQAMYESFGTYQLPMPEGARIETELAAPRPGFGAPPGRPAMLAAAALLSGKPVCVIGAEAVGLAERLTFLDTAVSLLPYGMRSRLSASTWASSTFQEHKLRLFFARSPRRDDQVVVWGRHDFEPVQHVLAADYLRWLEYDTGRPETLTRLAGLKEQLGFSAKDVITALELTDVRPDPGHYIVGEAPWSETVAASTDQMPHAGVWGAAEPTKVDELVEACIKDLHYGYMDRLSRDLNTLWEYADRPITVEQRQRCRSAIADHQLLRGGRQIKPELRDLLYELLLRFAFDGGITYADYLQVECWAGRPEGGLLPLPVVQAMSKVRCKDVPALLLVMKAPGDRKLEHDLRRIELSETQLIDAVMDPGVLPAHGRIVCKLAINELSERAKKLGPYIVGRALHRHGYLATALQARYHDSLMDQVTLLECLLRIVHGRTPDRAAVLDAFGHPNFVPTVAFHLALLGMVRADDTEFVRREFDRSILGRIDPGSIFHHRLRLLDDHRGVEDVQIMESKRRSFLRYRSR